VISNASQRQIAQKTGLSIGKVNYCLKALIDIGFIKIDNFTKSNQKINYAYILTPKGIKEKAVITKQFIIKKKQEYDKLNSYINNNFYARRHSNKHPNDFDDEIDLRELFYVLLEGKWIIVSVTAFVSIIGVIYSLSLPNIYESKALLVPVNSSSGISGAILEGYSGLAGLAGISLPSGGDEGNSAKAIQKISSLSFFENNILPNIYLPDLMAVKSWNSKTNT